MSDTPLTSLTSALPRMAQRDPEQVAIRVPGPRHTAQGFARYDECLTYAELDRRTLSLAHGLLDDSGLQRGDRVVVMLKPSLEFFTVMYALFRAGMVPVLIDPGIPRAALKQCLAETQAQGFIGVPLAHLGRRLLGWAPSSRINVTTGRGWFGNRKLVDLFSGKVDPLPEADPDELAAILFTSGSTGVPKGVEYKHRHFLGQLTMLGGAFGIEPGTVNFPTFPPFALFDPALGSTSIIPDMDARRPAKADPRRLHDAITQFGASQLFGSPALIKVLTEYGKPLPTLQRVMSAGAPVPTQVVAQIQSLLPDDAQFWTPYGATECLPVALIEGRQLVGTRAANESGAGTCVGRPLPDNEVRIVRIVDGPIADWSQVELMPAGEIGEITVTGPSTTEAYWNRPELTALAKIRDGERIVHRMGDVGYFDAQGRLWFCGRMGQRVVTEHGTLYTEQVEPVFNSHPSVSRSALVGVNGVPVVMIELDPKSHQSWDLVQQDLRTLAAQCSVTSVIEHFMAEGAFPVDIRHNAKIGREQLAKLAAKRMPA